MKTQESIFGKGIPAIPMMNTLKAYAYKQKLHFDSRWETLVSLYAVYNAAIDKTSFN